MIRDRSLEYETRVNRVIDHIREHLGEETSLAALARVAAFSPFHFHRVFRAITGETLFGFIQRQRIERAARALLASADRSILDVALDHGFSSPAAFARAFRFRFGMSATDWRTGGAARWQARHRSERKPGKQLRKAGKAPRRAGSHTAAMGRPRTMRVQVRELPPHRVAYMRYVGPPVAGRGDRASRRLDLHPAVVPVRSAGFPSGTGPPDTQSLTPETTRSSPACGPAKESVMPCVGMRPPEHQDERDAPTAGCTRA